MKLVQVENGGAVVYFMCHAVVFPAQTHVDGEILVYLPLVLGVGEIKRPPKLVAAPRGVEGERGDVAIDERGVRTATVV